MTAGLRRKKWGKEQEVLGKESEERKDRQEQEMTSSLLQLLFQLFQ